jgi:hypothetical protein
MKTWGAMGLKDLASLKFPLISSEKALENPQVLHSSPVISL